MKGIVIAFLIAILTAISITAYAAQPEWTDEVLSRYDYIDDFAWSHESYDPDKLFPVSKDGTYGFINASGVEVVEPIYHWVNYIGSGVGQIALDDKTGFVDSTGVQIVPLIYDNDEWQASHHEGGIIVFSIKKDGLWGFVDTTGTELSGFVYDGAGYYNDGMGMVVLNGKAGFINGEGGADIPPQYDVPICKSCGSLKSYDFSSGLAAVMLDGVWGYIRKDGSVAIEFQYEWASRFSEGLASVAKNGKWGFIDALGDLILPYEYGLQFDDHYDFGGVGDGSFAPDSVISRQDFAVILYRLMLVSGVEFESGSHVEFTDEADIAEYAAEAVRALSSVGIIVGIDGAINPRAGVTREQAFLLAVRAKNFTTGNTGWFVY